MHSPESYMRRCVQLAQAGTGSVAPNPAVGAVLVHNDRIIGEGYHQHYGEAHAEVNCISDAIRNGYAHVFPQSALFVTLEPCAHFGKTPPCADLIIEKKIPVVYVGSLDPFAAVDGKGIEKLLEAGVQVNTHVLEEECRHVNRRFLLFHEARRPYIVLKWAQTADGKIAGEDRSPLAISNAITKRLVHKWRSEEAAILVGTHTARIDDPQLNNRFWTGKQPIRIVIDRTLRLPKSLRIYNGDQRTIILNTVTAERRENVEFYRIGEQDNLVHEMVRALYTLGVQSVLVEGGAFTLQSFIDAGLWDEARVIMGNEKLAPGGWSAPVIKGEKLLSRETIHTDTITYYGRLT